MAYELRDFSDVAPETTVASNITNSDTSVNVASGTGYPSGGASGYFMIQIENELIKCASRTGNTIAFSGGAAGRGQNGTAAAGHVSGVAVNFVHTAINDSKEANYAVTKTVGKVTTSQDLLVADGANSFTRLGIGANGTILQAVAGAVGYGALPAGSVGASQITDGTVGTAELADNSVTTAKIADGNVTGAKIPAGAISAGHLALNAVVATNIAPGGISAAYQFASGVVDSAAILDGTIVNTDINAAAAIAYSKLAAPTADVSMNTHKITNVTDPGSAQDAATKNYVDGVLPLTPTSYTPTFTQGGTTCNKTIQYCKYLRVGPVVMVWFHCTFTSTGTTGQFLSATLPVNQITGQDIPAGGGRYISDPPGVNNRILGTWQTSTSNAGLVTLDFSSLISISSFVVQSGDTISGVLSYPVA